MVKGKRCKLAAICCLLSGICFYVGCGNWNIFSWTHKAGKSKDPVVLIADGEAALEKGDYSEAEEHFANVLEKQPYNSEALYGHAQAVMGASGLGIADIISSAIENLGEDGSEEDLKSLIPEDLNLQKLAETAKRVIADLSQITDGPAGVGGLDDNVDVNVNLAVVEVLQAATRIFNLDGDEEYGEAGEPVRLNSDYTVTFDAAALAALDKGKAETQIIDAVVDLVGGEKAAEILGEGVVSPEKQQKRGAIQHLETAIESAGLEEGLGVDLSESVGNLADNPEGETDLAGLWAALQEGG